MSKAVATIVRLERRVMWRQRLLSLQDGLALALAVSGIVAAGFVVLIRVRALNAPVWIVIAGTVFVSSASALLRWFFTRAREGDSAFLIDESLGLEDRVATSHSIIGRGGPNSALEEALIEDTAERVGSHGPSAVAPFKLRRRLAFSPVALIALAAALMITPRSLPVNEALAAERADIENAAAQLERTALEVAQDVPVETETARLASEQAALGQRFRKAATTRAEALRSLGELEERIRRRHDDLSSTRADEIVSLADRRLGGVLSTLPAARPMKLKANENEHALPEDASTESPKDRAASPNSGNRVTASSREKTDNSASTAPKQRTSLAHEQSKAENEKKQQAGEAQNEKREKSQERVSGTDAKTDPVGAASQVAGKAGASADKAQNDQKPAAPKQNAETPDEQKSVEQEKGDQPTSDKLTPGADALKAAPGFLANQAAKALPKLSEDLLKKAAQLRANELSPADIEKLRQAAESLVRELSQFGQSKDLQQALREMARQVRPEQIEQVARELGNHEKLKQELESAARLLAENHQAKEMVAGLAGEFARVRDETRQHQMNQKAGQQNAEGSGSRGGQTGGRDRYLRSGGGTEPSRPPTAADRSLAGQGREASLAGKLRRGSGGDYLYLQSKAGAGAARAPYSSAYPQYRREAERSVQRTQVPSNLRSVVRKYFDAINPDAKR